MSIAYTLNDAPVTAEAGESIWDAAKRLGIEIPHLCHAPEPGYRPDGNCRACMVEIEGERVLAASCIRAPSEGMVVHTASDRARTARKMVFEMLAADQPARETAPDPQSKFWRWADRVEISGSRLPASAKPAGDGSHLAMAVNLDACINCTLCVRACREVQVNDVIGMAYRGHGAKVVFDFDDPMGDSTCVGCGECVQACPTGALMETTLLGVPADSLREVDSVCPYCGVGCQLTYRIKDNEILAVRGRAGPANENRLCVKGRFGFDYVKHPHRLTRPMIRRGDAPKSADIEIDPANPWTHFREASWEEALARASGGLKTIRDRDGSGALAGFGSAKGSNEEAYLFQKLVRTGFGTNNVDHCTRLCHASSVAALIEGIGSGAVTAPFTACMDSDVIVVIGANPTENHPVAATFFKQAAKRGAKLIVMDPRGQALSKHASHMLQFTPGSDVAMLNAILHVIITERLYDRQYVAAQTEGFEQLKRHIADFSPKAMAEICGVDADILRDVARTFARAESAVIFWGMGISQHIHGTDNARCLIALALITGQIGRPGTGLHPLRGQNNVQGASDAGLIPIFYPDYQPADDAEVRKRFEDAWGTALDPNCGLTVVEIMDAVHTGEIKGMYIMGENPAMSDPGFRPRPRRAGQTRTSCGPGSVFDRNRVPRRCRAARLGLAGKGRHRHQHQPPGADGPPRARSAGRGARRLGDHSGYRQGYRARLELPTPARCLRRNEAGDGVARQYRLGAAGPRKRGHLSGRWPGPTRQRDRLRRRLPDPDRPRQAGAGEHRPAGGNARCRIPDGPDHRAAIGTLAYRGDDPAQPSAGRHRTRSGGSDVVARSVSARVEGRRYDPGRDAARRD